MELYVRVKGKVIQFAEEKKRKLMFSGLVVYFN